MLEAIVNASIITPLEVIQKGTVLIKDGKIARIIKGAGKIPKQKSSLSPRHSESPWATFVIDAKGKILCPGFIDLHLQGGGGADVIDSTYEAINCVSTTHAKYGTTSFLATTLTKPVRNGRSGDEKFLHLKPIVRAIEKGTDGAEVLGIHLEGPFINPEKKGMIRRDYIIKPDINKLREIIKICDGKLRMMTIAPELKGSIALIKELVKNKIVASLGHTDATYEEAMKGIESGISHATHFLNAMSGLHHRNPGAAGACLDSNLSIQLIADLVHIHPAVIKVILKIKGVDRVALITDAISAVDMPDGIYEAGARQIVAGGQKIIVKNGIVRGESGYLAGSTLTLNRAVRSMVSLGFSLQDAIRMASLTPARVLKIENNKGSIKEGMDADLILIDEKINVYMAMVGGKILWRK